MSGGLHRPGNVLFDDADISRLIPEFVEVGVDPSVLTLVGRHGHGI